MVMDEAAVAMRGVTVPRVIITLVAAAVALLVVAPAWSLVWIGGAGLIEAWSWSTTRPFGTGAPVSRGRRASFTASYTVGNLWWMLLAGLFWSAGTVTGQAAGLAVALAIVSVTVLLFHNVPAVFLLAGFAPAAGALAIFLASGGRDWRELAPVWATLGLGLIFSLGRAMETPSVQASNRRLNASLHNYEILTETVTGVIARIDLEGLHQYVSPACLRVLGYRPDELVGRSRGEIVHPDDLSSVRAAKARLLADPTSSEVIISRVRHKEGHWVWLESSAKAVCESGAPVGVIDVSHDVTERLAAERALREAKEQAESATQAKAEFLANVSHEIRTPMNGVLGALHLLRREDISVEGRELMRQADDCGRMLSQLLNDVLDFSKIDAGELELSPEAMDLGQALDAVGALLAPQARAKGIDLTWEIIGDRLWVQADPVRIRQAMFNLIGNAVKFTERGSVTVRLDVGSVGKQRRRARLEVTDTGVGIPLHAQADLFERFRQAEGDTARRFGGAGLGLAITRLLVHMMGGEIGFTSAEGRGSTFWATFDAPAADPVAAEPAAEGLLDGVSILLVEDNPTNRLVARTMLVRLGATVEEAEDGLAGLEAARRGAHDLILMDVQMPHMDGLQAARAIRGLLGPVAQVPIIALTANVMAHQTAQYRAAGMNGVVAKPISPSALLTEIARVVADEEAAPAVAVG